MRVLCIDDSKSVHAFLKACLESKVTDFVSVFDGEQAVDLLQVGQSHFDLIFLDWEMPKKTGPEVLADIKRLKVSTPVIMCTSKNQIADIAQVLGQGATEYVMKPFTKDIILEKVAMVLSRELKS